MKIRKSPRKEKVGNQINNRPLPPGGPQPNNFGMRLKFISFQNQLPIPVPDKAALAGSRSQLLSVEVDRRTGRLTSDLNPPLGTPGQEEKQNNRFFSHG